MEMQFEYKLMVKMGDIKFMEVHSGSFDIDPQNCDGVKYRIYSHSVNRAYREWEIS